MNEKISVIITAHDRKKYLRVAVQSVLDQEHSSDAIEIIVVKNFSDPDIDEFLNVNSVKNILTDEKSFGAKLAAGIDNASGTIMSFLDDDDIFALNKLDFIKKIFTENMDIVYLHNDESEIGENTNPFKNVDLSEADLFIVNSDSNNKKEWGKSMSIRGDWYVSCITLDGSFARSISETLRSSSRSLDKIMYLTATGSGRKLAFTQNKLTFYRMHQSLTGIKGNASEFREKRLIFTRESLEAIHQLVTRKVILPDSIPENIITEKLRTNVLLYEKGRRKESLVHMKRLLKIARESGSHESKVLAYLLLIRFFSITIAFKLFRYYQIRNI